MTNLAVSVGTKQRAVTPSDTTVVACQALYVGTAGTVSLIAEGDTVAVPWIVPAGGYVLMATTKIMATGTTATDIVAIFV
jgi:hypothetical protein